MDTVLTNELRAASGGTVATVNQVLAEDLKAMGVEVVFGLMSDDTVTLVIALEAIGIRFIGARHETQAVLLAEGYAFASDGLGVALIGRGPAATNALTGAIHASKTGSKVLLILGDDPILDGAVNMMGPDLKNIHTLGAPEIYATAGLRTFPVRSAGSARAMLAAAVAHAKLGRTATLHLPTTVQETQIEPGDQPRLASPPASAGPQRAAQVAIDTAVELLAKSRRPLIIAGWGAHRAGARETIEQLAERTGAILATTLKGCGMFHGNPYELGVIGTFSHSAGRKLIDEADCALVVGAGLNILTMSFGASLRDIPIIQVDANRASIGRWSTVQLALVGDARAVTEQLLDGLTDRSDAEKPFYTEETRRLLATFEHTQDFVDESVPRGIDPRSLGLELDRLLPGERTMVYDLGNFLGIVPYLSVRTPDHIKMTQEFASIGLGMGTAMGVAHARPDLPTVLVVGDGGLLMSLGELESVVREDLPLVIVVMNDRAYGAERHFLELRGLPIAKSMFPEADFAGIASALGYEAATIASLDDLAPLAASLANPTGPILLDCLINPKIAAPFMAEVAEFEASH
jgi:acetolactate synthase I/II/III large subunit